MFDSALNTVFGFLLTWEPTWAILFLSIVISLIMVIAYRLMTDQKEMKRLKEELSAYQKKMRETKDTEKLMKIQKELMSTNMQYMRRSMIPTFVTIIPLLLIFNWMSMHFAYEPLMPDHEFVLSAAFEKGISGNATVTAPDGLEIIGDSTKDITEGMAHFTLKGNAGDYFATITSNGEQVDKRIIISNERIYAPITEHVNSDIFKSVSLDNETLRVFWNLSWFWAYLIFAIASSMILRKALRVH